MGSKIYVGNLPFAVNKQTLQDRFSQRGMVAAVLVVAGAVVATVAAIAE